MSKCVGVFTCVCVCVCRDLESKKRCIFRRPGFDQEKEGRKRREDLEEVEEGGGGWGERERESDVSPLKRSGRPLTPAE